MADLQAFFERFHSIIKVDSDALVEKREIILNVIRAYLKKEGLPGFELVNQGSYIYGVGIEPTGDLEHDIDVGLGFSIRSKDYPDAAVVRKWVMEAVKGHTTKVVQKGPCIRVHYAAGFHVDLVVYAKYKDTDGVEEFQLAMKNGEWRPSDPKRLKDFIREARQAFKETKLNGGADQLQRSTRYMKRWNDEAMPFESDDKPCGLALLLFAIEKMPVPVLDTAGESDDLGALLKLAETAAGNYGRISIFKPTPEYEDVFAKLGDKGMTDLKDRFSELAKALRFAKTTSDADAACEKLREVLGDDFPTPETIKKNASDAATDKFDLDRFSKIAAITREASKYESPPKPWSRD